MTGLSVVNISSNSRSPSIGRAVWITDDRRYDLRHPRCCAKTASTLRFCAEIIDPGVTGHTASIMDEAIRMLPQVLSFRKCVQVVREPAEWPTKLI